MINFISTFQFLIKYLVKIFFAVACVVMWIGVVILCYREQSLNPFVWYSLPLVLYTRSCFVVVCE